MDIFSKYLANYWIYLIKEIKNILNMIDRINSLINIFDIGDLKFFFLDDKCESQQCEFLCQSGNPILFLEVQQY